MLENMTLSLINISYILTLYYNVFKRKHNLHIQSKERGKYANMSAYKITSYMYQGLISRALFAETTTWNIIWTLPIKPNQYEIHMILHYLAEENTILVGIGGRLIPRDTFAEKSFSRKEFSELCSHLLFCTDSWHQMGRNKWRLYHVCGRKYQAALFMPEKLTLIRIQPLIYRSLFKLSRKSCRESQL